MSVETKEAWAKAEPHVAKACENLNLAVEALSEASSKDAAYFAGIAEQLVKKRRNLDSILS